MKKQKLHTKENHFPIRVTAYAPPTYLNRPECNIDPLFFRFAGTKLVCKVFFVENFIKFKFLLVFSLLMDLFNVILLVVLILIIIMKMLKDNYHLNLNN